MKNFTCKINQNCFNFRDVAYVLFLPKYGKHADHQVHQNYLYTKLSVAGPEVLMCSRYASTKGQQWEHTCLPPLRFEFESWSDLMWES